MMRILGLDPGVATVGWAIVDYDLSVRDIKPSIVDFGVLTTDKGLELAERLSEIYRDLDEIVNKFAPDKASVETIIFAKNTKTAINVAHARGTILVKLHQLDIPIYEYTPLQVKSAIAGYGQADKLQIQKNVMMICGLDELPKPDDAADAIAIAICCYNSSNDKLHQRLYSK